MHPTMHLMSDTKDMKLLHIHHDRQNFHVQFNVETSTKTHFFGVKGLSTKHDYSTKMQPCPILLGEIMF